MSTVFRFGQGPGDRERKTVYADSGVESVELGMIDEYGRLIVTEDGSCSRVSLSADELLKLAAFVRKQEAGLTRGTDGVTLTGQKGVVELEDHTHDADD